MTRARGDLMAVLPLFGALRRLLARIPRALRLPVVLGAAIAWWVRRRERLEPLDLRRRPEDVPDRTRGLGVPLPGHADGALRTRAS